MCPIINENQMYYELNHIIFLAKEMMDYCDFGTKSFKEYLTKTVDDFYNSFIEIVEQFEFENRNCLY